MTESKSSTPQDFENGLSYLRVPGPPLRPLTLGQLVDDAARKWANSECFYDVPMNTRLTFGQLKNEVDLFASGLLKMGLEKGDRTGIWGPNSCRWIITFLAAAKVGIIIVPLNHNYEAPELLYALNHLSIKYIVLAEPLKTRNFYEILKQAVPDLKVSNESDDHLIPEIKSTVAPHLKQILYMGNEQLDGTKLWTEVQTMGKEEEDLEKMRNVAETVHADDTLHILFTSGTTGQAKGVMISHLAQINSLLQHGNRIQLTPEDKNCQTLPLFHVYGFLVSMFPLGFGSRVFIPSPTFSPSAAIKIIAQEKCTWIQGTPTMYFDMMNTPGFDQLDLSFLKGAVMGGAGASKSLLVEMQSKYRISRVNVGYGTTEGNSLTLCRIDDPPELALTSVGYPYENSEIKIIDARGRLVPVGERGEICCRNQSIMQGYWKDPEKTREVIDSDGWYHTGDAGYFLQSGHLALSGRLKDMLIRGGENIYPKEIEDFLYQNLSEEIEEVYVFGVRDERLGEVVAAWILPKPKLGVTMETTMIKGVCEGKISRSKIPVYVKFLQSKDDFPRTAIGKAQKNVMRRLYEKELGLTSKKLRQ